MTSSPASTLRTHIPGLALAAAIAAVAYAVVRWGTAAVGLAGTPLSPVLIAILVGLVIRNGLGVHSAFQPGLRLAMRTVLRIGVALLGIRLSLGAVAGIGAIAVPLVILTISAALIAVLALGRWLGLPRRLALLIATGTGICGISAIVATAPVIDADEHETSYAVATIALFGTLALFTYPYLARPLLGDPDLVGFFLGTAIHDTAQVVAAALAYRDLFAAPSALDIAVVTKLVRNLAMVAVIPLIATLYSRQEPGATRPRVPGFILAFLALALLRSAGDVWAPAVLPNGAWLQLVGAVESASSGLLVVAMAATGLSTDLRDVAALGVRPLAAGFAAALTVGAVSAALLLAAAGLGLIA